MDEFEARGYVRDGDVIGDHLDRFERLRLGPITLEELGRREVISYRNESHDDRRPRVLFFVHDDVSINRSVVIVGVDERAPADGFGTVHRTRTLECCNNICHVVGTSFGTQMYLKVDEGGHGVAT